MGSKKIFILMFIFVVFLVSVSFVYSANPKEDCQLCRRYADVNGRNSASWSCVDFDDTSLLTDFVGDVNADDDFDFKVRCTDPLLQTNCQLCRRYANLDGRDSATWGCVNFDGTPLLTDFVGNVNYNDDFDLKITCTTSKLQEGGQLCRRYADVNGRNSASWSCVNFDNTPLLTDFVGDVNFDDDFDLKINYMCECSSGGCCDGCNFRPNTYECRPKQRECDVAEYCIGEFMETTGCPFGMVGYWKFDASPQTHLGTVGDDSGSGNTGTFYTNDGATNKAVTGIINSALSFDGVDDYVSIPDKPSLNPTNQLTVAAWVKLNSPTSVIFQTMIRKQGSFALEPQTNQIVVPEPNPNAMAFALFIGSGWVQLYGAKQLTIGGWYYVVATYNGNKMRLYINGILDNEKDVTGNIKSTTNPLFIGKCDHNILDGCSGGGTADETFKGAIDEVAIYNRALTADEISKLYQNSLANYGYCEQLYGCQTLSIYSDNNDASLITSKGEKLNEVSSTAWFSKELVGGGAKWVWASDYNSQVRDYLNLSKIFFIPGNVEKANFTFGVDNFLTLYINGIKVPELTNVPSTNSPPQGICSDTPTGLIDGKSYACCFCDKPHTIDITNYLKQGDNKILLETVGEEIPGSTTTSNPAGVVFNMGIKYCEQPPTCVPLYRCYHPNSGDHMTTTYGDCEASLGTGIGYINEGILGYVYSWQAPGTIPLYRCYNSVLADHVNVLSTNCEGAAGYNLDFGPPLGYGYSSQQPNTYQFNRCYNSVSGDHLDPWYPYNSCPVGYNLENLNFYIYNQQNYCTEINIFPSCPSGIKAYWKLDETSGSVIDATGNGNDGTNYGATRGVIGKINNAYSFDGVDDYISIPDNPSLNPTNQLTVMAWIKANSYNNDLTCQEPGGIGGIVCKYLLPGAPQLSAGYLLRLGTGCLDSDWNPIAPENKKINFGIYPDGVASNRVDAYSNTIIGLGQWYYVVGTYDGSQVKLYINGNLEDIAPASGNIILTNNPLEIGRDFYLNGRAFDGAIDEVAIYGRALTADEISKHYQNSLAKYGYCEQPTTPREECPEDVFKPFGEKCSIGACDFRGNCLDCDASEEICRSSGCGNLKFFGNKCCGDDSNEYYTYRKGEIFDMNDNACCNSATDCAYNNTCYDGGSSYELDKEARYCNNGEWGITLKLKCDWNNENCDYCDSDAKCITPQKQCINSGEFIDEHYCEDGEWTSRTKLIALQLLDISNQKSPDNYTLFCDNYKNTLNYYQYLTGTIPVIEHLKEANNFCVLKLPEQVIVGTSLNTPINKGRFIEALTGIEDCDNAIGQNDGKFHQCNSGSSKAWYNNKTQSVIYSNKNILNNPQEFEINAWEAFLVFLKNPFQKIFGFLFDLFEKKLKVQVQDYKFIENTKDFSRIYLDRKNVRFIKGITENVKPEGGEYLSVTYSMYNENICGTVNKAYERFKPSKKDLVLCYYDSLSRSYYVVSNSSAALALWPDLTAKLRTRAPPLLPMQYCYVREENCEDGENAVLYLSDLVDAHASKVGVGGFGYRLCCSDDYELDSSCSQKEVVRLSSEEDAHANAPDLDLFKERVCVKAEDTSKAISCESVLYPGGCYTDEVCVVSLSDIADAHLSSCEDTQFFGRVCCKIT